MKKHYLFSACAAMALALTGCSSDEPNINGPVNGAPTTDPNGQYIAISLSNSDSRAGSSEEFVNGSTEENQIDNLHFLFFDAQGNPFKMTGTNITGTVNPDEPADGRQESSNWVKPTKILTDNVPNSPAGNGNGEKSVLVLGKADVENGSYQDGDIPARVICLANLSDAEVRANYENKSISALSGYNASNAAQGPVHTEIGGNGKSFVMTSSAWWNGTENVCWSNITIDNIKGSADEALKAPVQIYIERLAAKVTVNKYPTSNVVKVATTNDQGVTDYNTPMSIKYIYVDETTGKREISNPMNVIAEPTGWAINTKAAGSYGIKHLKNFNTYFASKDDWNTGVRSFWAETSTEPVVNTFIPATDLTNALNSSEYIYANTYDPFLQGNGSSGVGALRGQQHFARTWATKVLVGAQIYLVEEGTTQLGESAQPAQLMFWSGMYYTPEALCQVIKGETDKTIAFARVRDTSDKEGHYMVKFYTTANTEMQGKLIEENADGSLPQGYTIMSDAPAAQYWNGMAYYIINISNNLNATNATNPKTGDNKMYGVVRNHSYSYDLTDFVGLGTPVPVTDKQTRVENPTASDTYVAAKVNVLHWRAITHSTILQ